MIDLKVNIKLHAGIIILSYDFLRKFFLHNLSKFPEHSLPFLSLPFPLMAHFCLPLFTSHSGPLCLLFAGTTQKHALLRKQSQDGAGTLMGEAGQSGKSFGTFC